MFNTCFTDCIYFGEASLFLTSLQKAEWTLHVSLDLLKITGLLFCLNLDTLHLPYASLLTGTQKPSPICTNGSKSWPPTPGRRIENKTVCPSPFPRSPSLRAGLSVSSSCVWVSLLFPSVSNTTFYLVSSPNAPWEREVFTGGSVVLLNKNVYALFLIFKKYTYKKKKKKPKLGSSNAVWSF